MRHEEASEQERRYDIYERLFQFAVSTVFFVSTLPRTLEAAKVADQLVRILSSTIKRSATGDRQ